MGAVPIKSAGSGDAVVRGRESSSRAEWEAARAADAADLNRLLAAGGEVEVFVVPLWSNDDFERCLAELRGFDEARVYVEIVPGEGMEEALTSVAAAERPGAAARGDALPSIVSLIHAAASLDVPILLEGVPTALQALALAISEDLSPREIAAVLRGDRKGVPDAESIERAKGLLSLH